MTIAICKRVKALFVKPERLLIQLVPELQKLRLALEHMSHTCDPLTTIVHFFDIMSKWEDRGVEDLIMAFKEVNYGQYDAVLEKLRVLKLHFCNAGRSDSGLNRTKRGQTVTEDDVCLGNIYGLWTFTVRDWKKTKGKEPPAWGYPGMKGITEYDVISRQARGFMTSHIDPVVAILKYLEAFPR